MKIIGITGGVGSGKSDSAPTIWKRNMAQLCVRQILLQRICKSRVQSVIIKSLSILAEDFLDENGRIDRPHLARIVFKDDEELHDAECDCSSSREGKYPPEDPSGDEAGNRAFCTGGGTSPGRTL